MATSKKAIPKNKKVLAKLYILLYIDVKDHSNDDHLKTGTLEECSKEISDNLQGDEEDDKIWIECLHLFELSSGNRIEVILTPPKIKIIE